MKAKDVGKIVVGTGISEIPVVGSLYNEVKSYFEMKYINDRLANLEKRFIASNCSVDDVKEIMSKATEHDYYIVRNSLRNIVISTVPEVVDSYMNALVEYILNEPSRGQLEEICEIISNLSKNDISFMRKLKLFLSEQKIVVNHSDEVNNDELTRPGMVSNRVEIYSSNTIIMNDFLKFTYFTKHVNGKSPDIEILANTIIVDEEGKEVYYYANDMKAINKLQTLNVLTSDFTLTVGRSSANNIERLHLSKFGIDLMKYI